MVRLDKYICDLGIFGRSEARRMIKDGRVAVDGEPVRECDRKIDLNAAKIAVDGTETSYRQFHYYMLDKPAGILTATVDRKALTVSSCFRRRRAGWVFFPSAGWIRTLPACFY